MASRDRFPQAFPGRGGRVVTVPSGYVPPTGWTVARTGTRRVGGEVLRFVVVRNGWDPDEVERHYVTEDGVLIEPVVGTDVRWCASGQLIRALLEGRRDPRSIVLAGSLSGIMDVVREAREAAARLASRGGDGQ